MIELTHRGAIAIVKMVHGKANALDIEFCEAHRRAVRGVARLRRARPWC